MTELTDGTLPKQKLNTPSESNAIEVKKLKKHFKGSHGMEDVRAVDEISFNVKSGEVFGLLGTNGAGKTTTINILTGALLPDAGMARVGGYDLKKDLNKIKERSKFHFLSIPFQLFKQSLKSDSENTHNHHLIKRSCLRKIRF